MIVFCAFHQSLCAVVAKNVALTHKPCQWTGGVRTPVEVIKSRRQAGVVQDENPVRAAKHVVENAGVKGLYVGYASNIAYAFPADAIKFLVSPAYEFVLCLRTPLFTLRL
jgi:hypothetical protein